MFEICAAIAGLIQGILAYLNKRSSWLIYSLQAVFLILFSFMQKLYGDALQNVAFLFYCVYGYWMWGRSYYSRISIISRHHYILWIVVTGLLWLVSWLLLDNTDDPLPALDAATTSTTIVASVLLLFRKLETWIIWLANDVLYMIQYLLLPDEALYLVGLYIVWTILAILSFSNWLNIYKRYSYEI